MILAKDTDGQCSYLLPSGSSPPTSITWSLYDPDGNAHLTGQPLTPPLAYTVDSGEDNESPDDITLACTVAPAEIQPGGIARIVDEWGRVVDGLCYGRKDTELRVADVPHELATEAASVWSPEVEISIPAAQLDETGAGWRIDLVIVQDGATVRDTVWFSVGLYLVSMRVSEREVLDRHPAARSDLVHAETRRDWPRIIGQAIRMVEETIQGQDRWYTQLVSQTGLRSAVVAAAWKIIAPALVPDGYDAAAWGETADRDYTAAVGDLLGSAYTDTNLDGIASDDERNPRAHQFRRIH